MLFSVTKGSSVRLVSFRSLVRVRGSKPMRRSIQEIREGRW